MHSLKVSDYINRHPVIFSTHMTVAEAVEKLLQCHQTGGPVVDDRRKLVGFLSEQDCMKQMLESSYYREQAARVSDIMRTDVLAVSYNDSVIDLAQQMLGAKPKIYPVTDEDGGLIGTINRTDILRAIDLQLKDGYQQAV